MFTTGILICTDLFFAFFLVLCVEIEQPIEILEIESGHAHKSSSPEPKFLPFLAIL